MRENPESRIPDSAAYREWFEAATSIMAAALATGASCGAAVATAYCRSRDYARAESFRKIEREEITGILPATTGSSDRDEFVAIECLR
jgi:hypothetical protein